MGIPVGCYKWELAINIKPHTTLCIWVAQWSHCVINIVCCIINTTAAEAINNWGTNNNNQQTATYSRQQTIKDRRQKQNSPRTAETALATSRESTESKRRDLHLSKIKNIIPEQ